MIAQCISSQLTYIHLDFGRNNKYVGFTMCFLCMYTIFRAEGEK